MGSINGFAGPKAALRAEKASALSAYDVEKRALDIIISLAALILLLPVLLLAAAAVKLDSGGPVFYKRRVVGKGKRAVFAYKLRTMVNGADGIDWEDPSVRMEMHANHKLRCDFRVTRTGRILRKTSIDELPQLLNVLLGQMSLVGPRMISFPEMDKFGIWQDRILSVKPGITGLWQVKGRSKLSYEDRVALNVFYVDRRSLSLDLYILFKTIPAVLTGNGAY